MRSAKRPRVKGQGRTKNCEDEKVRRAEIEKVRKQEKQMVKSVALFRYFSVVYNRNWDLYNQIITQIPDEKELCHGK